MDSFELQQGYGLMIVAAVLVSMTIAASGWIYLRKKKATVAAPKKTRPPSNIEAARMRAADRLATRAQASMSETQQAAPVQPLSIAVQETMREDKTPAAIPPPVTETAASTSSLYERMGIKAEPPPPPPPPAPAPAPAPPALALEKESVPLSPKEAFKKSLAEHNAQIGKAQKEYKRSFPAEQQHHPTWEKTYENPTYDEPIEPIRSSGKPRLRISYRDSHGEMTSRQIDVREYSLAYESMEAYCHLRKAHRTFYFDRVRDAIDMETGEQIRNLSKYFEDIYRQTPQYAIDQFVEQHGDALFVLFCVAKADGRMVAMERHIIKSYAEAQGLTEPGQINSLLTEIAGWDATTRTRFHTAVRAVKSDNKRNLEALFAACVQIVQTDKATHSDEARMLIYTAKQWGLPIPEWLKAPKKEPL